MAKGARHELRSKGKGVQKTYGKGRDRTRADKPKLIEDPELEEQVLRNQLREAGLYAANVLGDGNCLFRALSDQLYGSPSMHLAIRQEVCDYLSSHPDRFRLFVDEDSVPGGFDGHVRSMRQPGTYGTNIELSAFVARYRRPVKIWQPNLIYVMPVEEGSADSAASGSAEGSGKEKVLSPREKRAMARAEREKEKEREKGAKGAKGKQPAREEKAEEEERESEEDVPLCIVYHSWEHYSSLRNLTGPHTGPPRLRVDRVGSARPEDRRTASKEPDAEAEEAVDEDEPMEDESPSRPPSPLADGPPSRLRLPDRQSASSAPPILDLPHPSRLPPLPTTSRPRSPPPAIPSSSGLLSPPHPSVHERAIALPLPPSPRPSSPADSSSSGTSTGVASSSFGSSAPSTVASSIRDRSMSPFPPSQGSKTGYAVTEESPLHDEFHHGEGDEEETDSSDAHRDKVRSRSSTGKEKLRPPPRTRRGPSAKEKKELARQRRMERRRAKGVGASGGVADGSSDRVLRSAGPASDAGLAKVRELYI
ncbi:hypothetical protein NBRC10512_001843 [Rhodotorula toruloides]|uniref:RHTO0S19e01002g1_1 n=2 Tax=Rhodotorula toruloides TaxID=5286 RepID=A0A061BFA4_RHOTO|nr:OTU domain-containing protein 3 [Rhodotorula toruloides NP11]EMS20187.1 OTU domain-containing protein 3 [Rhodotorula toruloides NP11]CDR48625.1 RHTO0S19e01002g1_1 [Rhodotorula toruloides]